MSKRKATQRRAPRLEQRAGDASWTALQALTPAGNAVNARYAENLSTVLACVSAISTAIASLPPYVYRVEEKSRAIDTDHSLMRLVRKGPNPHQTWPDFVEWLVASTLLRGNGLAEILTDTAGRVTGLVPIPWDWVMVSILPSGRLAFDVTEVAGIYGGLGRTRRLLEGEVLHLKDRSDDGLIGRSRLSRAGAVVDGALTVQDFAAAMYANGANPSGVLKIAGKMGEPQLDRMRAKLESGFTGSQRAGRILITTGDVSWQQLSVTPEDAELLQSRRFGTEELARLFGCPPPIIGDLSHGTFTNSETAGRWFAQHTLTPWIRKIEAEFARSVLSGRTSHSLELDLSGFLRGDPETRWRSHEIAVRNEILTPNEVREVEGWNPRNGGNSFKTKPEGSNNVAEKPDNLGLEASGGPNA